MQFIESEMEATFLPQKEFWIVEEEMVREKQNVASVAEENMERACIQRKKRSARRVHEQEQGRRRKKRPAWRETQ